LNHPKTSSTSTMMKRKKRLRPKHPRRHHLRVKSMSTMTRRSQTLKLSSLHLMQHLSPLNMRRYKRVQSSRQQLRQPSLRNLQHFQRLQLLTRLQVPMSTTGKSTMMRRHHLLSRLRLRLSLRLKHSRSRSPSLSQRNSRRSSKASLN
jgi:hypothetical protein